MRLFEVAEIVGEERLPEFLAFMFGQTVGLYGDGQMDYFECDVYNFLRKKEDRFFD